MSRGKLYASYSSLAPKKEPEPSYKCTEIQSLEHRKQVISENAIVCFDLYANWCEPCKILAPQYTNLAQQYSSPGRCLMVKENVDLELTRDYQITGIPAFIFYRKGQLLRNQDGSPVHVIGGDLKAVQEIMDKLLGQGV